MLPCRDASSSLLHIAWLLVIFENAEQSEKTYVKMLWLGNHCVYEAPSPQEAPLLSEHDGDQAKPAQLKVGHLHCD